MCVCMQCVVTVRVVGNAPLLAAMMRGGNDDDEDGGQNKNTS